MTESSPSVQKESGAVDFEAAVGIASNSKNPEKRKSYRKWSSQERFTIGKYAAIYGHTAATRKFGSKSRPINESSARGFCKLYHEEIKTAKKEKQSIETKLAVLPRGRPLLLGSLDQMVQKFIFAVRNRGGLITTAIAISVAKALISRNLQLNLGHIDLDSSSWAKSLFKGLCKTYENNQEGRNT